MVGVVAAPQPRVRSPRGLKAVVVVPRVGINHTPPLRTV
jgi:hypothetical protein